MPYTADAIVKTDQLYRFKENLDGEFSTIDETVAGVQVNGSDLTPDINHKVNVTVQESTNNGKIKVNGSDVNVHGLDTAAYQPSSAFDASGAAAAVLGQSTDGSSANTVFGVKALANTKAPTASPTFTGTPTAPTPTSGDNTTQLATTAFVQAAISAAHAGVATFQGTLSSQSTLTDASYKSGWYWVVNAEGTYAGQKCEVGDMIYAIADKGASYSASDFSVVNTNLELVFATDEDIDAMFE